LQEKKTEKNRQNFFFQEKLLFFLQALEKRKGRQNRKQKNRKIKQN